MTLRAKAASTTMISITAAADAGRNPQRTAWRGIVIDNNASTINQAGAARV